MTTAQQADEVARVHAEEDENALHKWLDWEESLLPHRPDRVGAFELRRTV